MAQVRACPVVDQVEQEGQRVVLLEERTVRVVGMALPILDLATDWLEVDDLVARLEEMYGAPESGSAIDLVLAGVRALAAEGLLEVR